jgi:hypothetical protein
MTYRHPDETLVVIVTNGDGIVCGRWSWDLVTLLAEIKKREAVSELRGAAAFNRAAEEIAIDVQDEAAAALLRVVTNKAIDGTPIRNLDGTPIRKTPEE